MRRPVRRSVRLQAPVYDGGHFFVTVCTAARVPLLGDVVDGTMRLSSAGRVAASVWNEVACRRTGVVSDAFVMMPDHVHLLFGIVPAIRAGVAASGGMGTEAFGESGTACCAPTANGASAIGGDGARAFGRVGPGTVPSLIRGYKSAVTRAIRLDSGLPDLDVWQRGYHDRIVRTDVAADAIRRYIAENPARWAHDTRPTTP